MDERQVPMSRVVDWNGRDVPDELRSLPPGRYVLESVDDLAKLTPEEEDGLEAAIRSIRAGKGVDVERVRALIDSTLKR
jgi:hypothetical protein